MAARFGAMPGVEDIALSPDGTKVAIVSPYGGGQVLMIADLVAGGDAKTIMRASAKDGRLFGCVWATDSRIVCKLHMVSDTTGLLLGFTRNFALDADGSNIAQLSARESANALGIMQHGGTVIDWGIPDAPGSILVSRQFIPEKSTASRLASSAEGLGVEKIETVTLRRAMVEQPRRDALEYISDGRGTVRILGTAAQNSSGYLTGRLKYAYRMKGSRSWTPLGVVEADAQTAVGFVPYAVDSDRDVVYGFESAGDGFQKLYSLALDGTQKKELVLGRDDVDVNSLLRIGRDARVVGASYATDRRVTEYFDPELRKLSAALGKALPGGPRVDFLDASADESKLLLMASADTLPGTVYLFDKATRKLEEVLPLRPKVDGVVLAPMKAVTYPAADGTLIPAYLTLPVNSTGKGLPAIVMPHGGPSSRDEWGFDWMVQFFAARGFAVIQPNFRGSAGYGEAWYQRNGFQSWRMAIGDVNDAGRWLASQGIAAPGKMAIVGWSYGGYAALQSAVLDPDLFKAIVAIAPVTDLELLRVEAAQYDTGKMISNFIGQGPHVREGSPAQNVERFKAPVLMFHGDHDQNVAVGESRHMEKRLKAAGKAVTYVEFPGLRHNLSDSAARTRILSESDAFIRKGLGL